MKFYLSSFILFIAISSVYAKDNLYIENMTQEACLNDLNYSADFLLKNDAGIVSENWTKYPINIQQYLKTQNSKKFEPNTVEHCYKIINGFFKEIRTGHLWLSKTNKHALKENPITTPKHKKIFVKQLSVHTTYVYLPSFFPYAQSEIQQMIDENKAGIKTSDYLIFDLRDNGGGFDSSFEPLFSLMGVQEYKVDIPSVYASEKNTKSWEDILQYINNTEDKKNVSDIVQNMKTNQNKWVKLFTDSNKIQITEKDIVSKTKKIAILIDKKCGSSCEQFVLYALNNPRVITIGRNTFGAIDASNVRAEMTPSKKFKINYATTFVLRENNKRIDGIGIRPQIVLKQPKNLKDRNNEISTAKSILESNQ